LFLFKEYKVQPYTDIPVFVINLDNSTERLESAQKQLTAMGIAMERFPAVYGKHLTLQQVEDCYDVDLNRIKFRRPLSPGEIGCYLSHRSLWQKMVEQNIAVAIVLEDDIDVEVGFPDVIQQLRRLQGWDMIKLSDDRDGKGDQALPLDDTYRLVNFHKVPNCTTGYAISLSGAKKLLTRKKFYRPVDVDLQFYNEVDLTLYSILPYTIWPSSRFNSEIDQMSSGSRKRDTSFLRNLHYRVSLGLLRITRVSGKLSEIKVDW
jgi:glycosyl transferase family 25